jgi:1-aminocyclopropane-1-carboxylate deaminase/D-cysteine desulfhydrase-like pyridoxal-dependent ACC family enzyme
LLTFGGAYSNHIRAVAAIKDFFARNRIALERVYVAKMMYGVFTLVTGRAFDPGTRLLIVITGAPGPE